MDLNEGSLFQKRKKDPESPGPEAPDVHPSGAVRAEADSGVGGQPVQPVRRDEGAEERDAGQGAEQQAAQKIAGQQLAQAHCKGIEGIGSPETRAEARLKPGDLRPHDGGVAQHRGQGSQPAAGHPLGQQAGQKGGGGAAHDVQRIGGKQVGHDAPHEQARGSCREEKGQNGEGLGHADLDAGEGGNGQDQGQGGVHRRQEGCQGQDLDREFAQKKPPFSCVENAGADAPPNEREKDRRAAPAWTRCGDSSAAILTQAEAFVQHKEKKGEARSS